MDRDLWMKETADEEDDLKRRARAAIGGGAKEKIINDGVGDA